MAYNDPIVLDWMEPGSTVYIDDRTNTWSTSYKEATVAKVTKTQITVQLKGSIDTRRFILPKWKNDPVVEFGSDALYRFGRPTLVSYMDGQHGLAKEHELTMIGRAQSRAQGAAAKFYNGCGSNGKWVTPDMIVELKANLDEALALFAEMGLTVPEPVEGE